MRKLEKRVLDMWARRVRDIAKSHFPPDASGIEVVRISWHVYTACDISTVVAELTGRNTSTGEKTRDLAAFPSEYIYKLQSKHPDSVENSIYAELATAVKSLKDRINYTRRS